MPKQITELVVIGAGVAGLAWRRRSTRQVSGQRSSKRGLGGGVWTIHPYLTKASLELGAEFIHGLPQEVWQIVELAGLPTHERRLRLPLY
jgi:hypothetical protein